MEIWKDMIGYEGLYQVSNYGRVKSLERKVRNRKNFRIIKERILKPGIKNNSGYFHISFYKNNKSKSFYIHRLVAIHFIPNFENKPFINHKDGNKLNNYIDNLEWCTASENIQHAYDNGLCENSRKAASINGKKYGAINSKRYRSKKVQCIETGIVYESTMDAERKTGINHSSISQCCKGKLKSAGKHFDNLKMKLTWKYI